MDTTRDRGGLPVRVSTDTVFGVARMYEVVRENWMATESYAHAALLKKRASGWVSI
jgi:hypothetical protein